MQNNDPYIFCSSLFLIIRFNIYFLKKCFSIPLNYLDCSIGNILDEYSYFYDFRKEWKKRK